MNISKYIDHTLLKCPSTKKDIENICKEAIQCNFAAVCINPLYVQYASSMLKDKNVKVATVVGFPLGATTTDAKVYETAKALKNGADEIDMVMSVGAFKDGDQKYVEKEIALIVKEARSRIVKVIIETCYLTPQEILVASKIVVNSGAHFVKTSTGFGTRGASLEDIKIIKDAIGDKAKIKASGGIKTYEQAMAMIEAGASRIGTSSGVEIVIAPAKQNDQLCT